MEVGGDDSGGDVDLILGVLLAVGVDDGSVTVYFCNGSGK